MVDCNRQVLAMFGAQQDQLVGRSFEVLYPSADEFERTGARIVASSAPRPLCRRPGDEAHRAGELFWCHVAGRALDPAAPHAAGIWASKTCRRAAC
jgi:hypothetical protein